MKSFTIVRHAISCLLLCLLLNSCSKDSDSPVNSAATTKRNWITSGTWKQKDLQLAYPIPFGGQTLPVGFSLYNIAGFLPVSGPMINCTKENTYSFNTDSSYAITGCTDLILPGAGNAGKWRLEIHDAVLRLIADESNPYWTNTLVEDEWSLGMTVYIAEAKAHVPVNLIIKKD